MPRACAAWLLQKAAEGLTAVLAREPKSVFGRYAMRFAYYWQARDFADLQRYSDAVGAWDTAIRFDDYHDSLLCVRAAHWRWRARAGSRKRRRGQGSIRREERFRRVLVPTGADLRGLRRSRQRREA